MCKLFRLRHSVAERSPLFISLSLSESHFLSFSPLVFGYLRGRGIVE